MVQCHIQGELMDNWRPRIPQGLFFQMPQEPTTRRSPCSLSRRLAVMVYDSFAVLALMLLATSAAMLAGFRDVSAGRDVLFTAWLLLVWFLYLAWCWRSGGMTIGMRAWRVSIEYQDGGRPGWARCLLRFLVSLLSAAVLGAGFLWSLFDRDKRCWHDMASATRLWHLPKR